VPSKVAAVDRRFAASLSSTKLGLAPSGRSGVYLLNAAFQVSAFGAPATAYLIILIKRRQRLQLDCVPRRSHA
jgi:hypothetical protein